VFAGDPFRIDHVILSTNGAAGLVQVLTAALHAALGVPKRLFFVNPGLKS
jgi:hypothetical protein